MKTIFLFILSITVSTLSYGALASQDWTPISAESLVKLPPNLIEKRIDQDFRLSPSATELLQIEKQMTQKSQQISALNELLESAQEFEMIDEKVDLVQLKSSFLDLLQDGQKLRQKQITDKIEVYQNVLSKMYASSKQKTNNKAYELKLKREDAYKRMQAVFEKVDKGLFDMSSEQSTPYAKEFSDNLAKIDKLRDAIAQHKASMSQNLDGQVVSSEEYIRQLLMQVSKEQSLLDQEGLMLSYMSKLVALDAQALEFTIAQNDENDPQFSSPQTTPASSMELFL